MRPPTPLPAPLRDRAFRIGEAAEFGVTVDRLRREDLARPTWGVRELHPAATVHALAVATALALPEDCVFSHLTAARLHDLPAPSRWDPAEALHVMRVSRGSRIRRKGCMPHKGLELRRFVERNGLKVVSPEDTWCDLADELAPDDLIILGDAVVHFRKGIPLERLAAAVERRGTGRGAARMRKALAQLRPRSNSPMETKTRLVFLRGGLPEPELNAVILDQQSGEWLSESDFVWRRERVVAEYDGDGHRTDKGRWRNDQHRRENLVTDGWNFVLLNGDDLQDQRQNLMLSRVQRLLDTANARLSRGQHPWG